jgi:hypothetical protein
MLELKVENSTCETTISGTVEDAIVSLIVANLSVFNAIKKQRGSNTTKLFKSFVSALIYAYKKADGAFEKVIHNERT